LFKLQVPKPEYWHRHRDANDILTEECYNNFRLAFVKVLEAIPVGNLSEKIPGPELARCRLPTGNSAYEKALRQYGGKVIEINSIEKIAHLILEHFDSNIEDGKKV